VAYLSDEVDLNSLSAQLFMYNFNCNATFGCAYKTTKQTEYFTLDVLLNYHNQQQNSNKQTYMQSDYKNHQKLAVYSTQVTD